MARGGMNVTGYGDANMAAPLRHLLRLADVSGGAGSG